MCRSRRNALAASQPTPRHPTTAAEASTSTTAATDDVHHHHRHRRYSTTNSASIPTTTTTTTTTAASASSSSTTSSSISGLRLSLSISENPILYPFTDISAATNNFLSKRLSSSSCWRCTLRGKDVVIFQRPFRGDPANLPSRLSILCKSHHSSLINLLGASLGGGDYIYLVYRYVAGATLQECLRNPRNPNFTPLSKWISRMQIATDLADGLDYIHNHCNTIHNRIKSSSIIVTEPNFRANICHFGAAELADEIIPAVTVSIKDEKKKKKTRMKKKTDGEISSEDDDDDDIKEEEEKESESKSKDEMSSSERVLRRSNSKQTRFEGTRGYIAPEVMISGGKISLKSDVFAFGVVILELISGKEPFKYTMNKEKKEYERISLIDTARYAIGSPEDEEDNIDINIGEEERRGRIRQWVDRRLRDSFPVEVAEKLVRVALQCLEDEAYMRPDMTKVAGKVSKLFLDSKVWEENLSVPADFSVTYGPR